MPKMRSDTIPQALHRRIRRHVQAKAHQFFAVVQPGFEHTALRELRDLNIGNEHALERGGLSFSGTLGDCYRANLASRTITRIIMRIAEFHVRRFAKLRELAGEIPWELFLTPARPVSFAIAVHASRLYHTERISQECYRAIRARFALCGLEHPAWDSAVQSDDHAQTIFIRIVDDRCTVSIDSTGAPLYKRGYKTLTTDAPLRETTAAALLIEAECAQATLLVDPMCGSGTFSLEAGMIALGIPPGLGRHFAFEHWPAYSDPARRHIEKEFQKHIITQRDTAFRILAADIDHRALSAARANLSSAGLAEIASFRCEDFFSSDIAVSKETTALIALNPPYGKRLGDPAQTLEMYKRIGNTLRSVPHVRYAVIVPGREFEQALALPFTKRISFEHGGIAVKALIKTN